MITVAWRGTPEHFLPTAVAALPVQMAGLRARSPSDRR